MFQLVKWVVSNSIWNEDKDANQYEILQHTKVDIINGTKTGSMKWFNATSDFVKTELTTQLLQWVGKIQLDGFLLIGKASAAQNTMMQNAPKKQNIPYLCGKNYQMLETQILSQPFSRAWHNSVIVKMRNSRLRGRGFNSSLFHWYVRTRAGCSHMHFCHQAA